MITIKEIAELAGVSRRTVDRVLYNRGDVNAETRIRIEKIMKEHDFVPNKAARGLAVRKKKLQLGFCSIKAANAPLFKIIVEGAQEKAKELEAFGVSVEYFIFDRNIRLPKEELEQMVHDFNCDGLAVVPGELPEIQALIIKAKEMGIPIVYYNTDSTFSDRLCYVGADYRKAGRLAAGMTALTAGNEGEVAVISVRAMSDYSYQERIAGFENELRTFYQDMRIVDKIVLQQDENISDMAAKLHAEYPDLRAVYLVNPGDYTLCKELRKLYTDKKFRIITNDLIDEDMLKSGVIDAVITQDPVRQGKMPLQILFDYLAYDKKPEKEFNYMTAEINISQSL